MKRSAIIGAVFGAAAVSAAAGFATYSLVGQEPDTEAVAAQNCRETQVERPARPKDDKRIAGSAIGAIVGGAVGSDLGDSDLTTAAGAATGAYAGNQAQKKFQENRTENTTEVRCD